MPVNQNGDETQDLTTFPLHAQFAENHPEKTNIAKQSLAPYHAQLKCVGIKSIRKLGEPIDVYCIGTKSNGTIIANGIVVKNCDALRYAVFSAFPTGEINHPDQNLTIEQIRKKIYGDEGYGFMNPQPGGYI